MCQDRYISPLTKHADVTPGTLEHILSSHRELTKAFYRLTRLDKRSLASKYLHFHHPRLFFIYDTRADFALRLLSIPRDRKSHSLDHADRAYSLFCLKCLALRDHVKATFGVRLSPRQLDNLLLEVSRTHAS
jgi:hypothetical protein